MFRSHLFASLTVAAVLALAPVAAHAGGGATYNVNLTAGKVSVIGTITTDTFGNLSASDFTSYSLTCSTPNGGTNVLTQANGRIYFFGAGSVTATASTLFTNTTDGKYASFGISRNSLTPNYFSFEFQTYSDNTDYLLIQNFANYNQGLGDRSKQGLAHENHVIGTAVSSVPEPSFYAMSSLLVLGGASSLLARKRRRTDATD